MKWNSKDTSNQTLISVLFNWQWVLYKFHIMSLEAFTVRLSLVNCTINIKGHLVIDWNARANIWNAPNIKSYNNFNFPDSSWLFTLSLYHLVKIVSNYCPVYCLHVISNENLFPQVYSVMKAQLRVNYYNKCK